MRVSVNLATRPFVELRLFFLRLRMLMGALALAALAIAITAHVLSLRAARQQAEMDRLRDQTIAAQREKLHVEQRMRQPANAAVLDRAHFLNTVFLRKSFSWTAVMMDLENVLPAGVQVTSIEPAVTADGQVLIRLRVAGERARAVQLVRNLERSRRFLQPRLGSESAQNREGAANGAVRPGVPGVPSVPTGPPGVEFEILADYNPLPAGEPYSVGHGRVATSASVTGPAASEATGSGAYATSAMAARESRAAAAANVGNGYPANGVVLQPYDGTRTASPAASPAQTYPTATRPPLLPGASGFRPGTSQGTPGTGGPL